MIATAAVLHAEHLHHVHVQHVRHVEHERRLHLAAEYASWQAHHENQAPAPVLQPLAPQPAMGISSAAPYTGGAGSYESCVIAHESGGNYRAVNAESGAGGAFQFLPSTWAGLGLPGLPQNASVAMQNQAFNTLYALAGDSPWITDGCVP